MGTLESRVKPLILPLMADQQSVLNITRLTAIARWIALKTMVAEYETPILVSSLQAERTFLMQNEHPPEGWRIFLGRHASPDWQTTYSRNAATLWHRTPPPRYAEVAQPRNTQAVTMGIGQLLLHVVATNVDGLKLPPGRFASLWMKQIWPDPKGFLWRTLPLLNRRQIGMIANELHAAISDPRFPWVPGPDIGD
jgi:hypothetical protein